MSARYTALSSFTPPCCIRFAARYAFFFYAMLMPPCRRHVNNTRCSTFRYHVFSPCRRLSPRHITYAADTLMPRCFCYAAAYFDAVFDAALPLMFRHCYDI